MRDPTEDPRCCGNVARIANRERGYVTRRRCSLRKRFTVLAKKAEAFFEEAGGGIVEGTAPCRPELGATLRGTEGVGRRYSTRAS